MLALVWFTTKGSKDLLLPITLPTNKKVLCTLEFRMLALMWFTTKGSKHVNSYNDFDNSFGVGKYR